MSQKVNCVQKIQQYEKALGILEKAT